MGDSPDLLMPHVRPDEQCRLARADGSGPVFNGESLESSSLRGATGGCSATPLGRAAGGRDAPVELGRAGVALAAEPGAAAVGLEATAEREGGRRRTMGPEVLQTGDGLLHRGDRPLGDPPEAQDRLGRGLEEVVPTAENST
jgi:hypothetical protein